MLLLIIFRLPRALEVVPSSYEDGFRPLEPYKVPETCVLQTDRREGMLAVIIAVQSSIVVTIATEP